MAIPEAQLEVWSKQGAIPSSKDTYAAIRTALTDAKAPFAAKSCEIYLQGSYCNDTNVYADSDVDVVIETNSIYYDDRSGLSDEDRRRLEKDWSKGAFTIGDFKAEVQAQLKAKFGDALKPAQSRKALYVEGAGARRNADVLVAVEHRRYLGYRGVNDQDYAKGICFWTTDGTKIVNYPNQHSENCTAKHQATNSWFKPTIRILKNLRNRMVADGAIEAGLAPSYFLEGLLYNVPNDRFGKSYDDTLVATINWLIEADRSKLVCANEQFYLLNAAAPECWRAEKLRAFLDSTVKYWNDWS